MISFPIAGVTSGLLGFLMASLSLFLILLVLVQRGKGGGLAGALGGPGGQSAFGSKAGDTFTWITVGVATVWGIVCALAMLLLGTHAPSVADEPNLQAGVGDDAGSGGLVIPSDESVPMTDDLMKSDADAAAGGKPMTPESDDQDAAVAMESDEDEIGEDEIGEDESSSMGLGDRESEMDETEPSESDTPVDADGEAAENS